MKINFRLALAAVVVLGLGVGVWLGTWQAGGQTAQAAASGRTAQSGANYMSGGAGAAGGAVTTGIVDTLGDQQFTVKPNGSSDAVMVRVTSGTTISKQTNATVADLQKDQRVLVRGTAAADGTINAATLQIGTANAAAAFTGGQAGANGQGRQAGMANGGANGGSNSQMGQMGQMGQGGAGDGQMAHSSTDTSGSGQGRSASGGQNSSDGQNGAQNSGASIIFGAVQGVDGDVVTIQPQGVFGGPVGTQASPSSGPVKVKLTDQTTISKAVDVSFPDIKAGSIVAVRGPSGVDGIVAASNIQILPADVMQQFRRGQGQ